MFDIVLSFDGLYLTLVTSDVTLSWDGLGSLLISVPPGSYTCGLCGNNDQSSSNDLQSRFTGGTSVISQFVKSWALDRYNMCKHWPVVESATGSTIGSTIGTNTAECEVLPLFYAKSCYVDSVLQGVITADIPLHCWSTLAHSHWNDFNNGENFPSFLSIYDPKLWK